MTDGYIKFNDVLTAIGNMLKEMGSKEVTINDSGYDLSEFCDKLYKNAYEQGKADAGAEIIHCRECKHSKEYDDGGIWCERLTGVFKVDHDGFCKWGKNNAEGCSY